MSRISLQLLTFNLAYMLQGDPWKWDYLLSFTDAVFHNMSLFFYRKYADILFCGDYSIVLPFFFLPHCPAPPPASHYVFMASESQSLSHVCWEWEHHRDHFFHRKKLS